MKKKTFQTGKFLTIPQISSELTGAKSGLSHSPLSMKIMQKYRVDCENNDFNVQKFINLNDFLFLINEKINITYIKEKKFIDSGDSLDLINFNNENETIIHIIKRIIDDLIMLSCIKYDFNNYNENKKIQIESIGDIKRIGSSELALSIKNNINYTKFEDFFTTINDLHNAFKHCILTKEFRYGIKTLYAKKNNSNNVVFLDNDLAQIILGFEDFLYDFTGIKPFEGNHSIQEYDA